MIEKAHARCLLVDPRCDVPCSPGGGEALYCECGKCSILVSFVPRAPSHCVVYHRQIIYDLIRSHDDPDGVDTGEGDGGGESKNSNRAAVELSTAFREHVFCLDGPPQLEKEGAAARRMNPQAVGLGIEVLNFLRGRQVG